MPQANSRQGGTALTNQVKVVRALMLRDIISRFGRGNIGFVWVIVEPMILCTGVLILWSAMKAPIEHGLPIMAMVLTGYMPLTLWRHLGVAGLAIMRRNFPLMYHRKISVLDIFLAKVFTEILATTAGAICIYVILYQLGYIEPPVDLRRVLVGWLLMCWYSTSTGLIIAALSESTEVFEKFIPGFMYLTLPLSGCFFLLDWMPGSFRDIILYFPLPHCYEIIREGYFGNVVNTYGKAAYVVGWSIAQSAIGLWLLDRVRVRVNFA